MQTRVIENTGHSGTKAEGYTRGLQWVFARPSVQLPEATLKQYVGTYVLGKDTVTLSIDKGALLGVTSNNERAVLSAASEEEFFSTMARINMRFKKEAGRVSGFILDSNGNEVFVKKVK